MEAQIAHKFHETLTLEREDDDDKDSCSSDFEFSFAGAGDASSPVPAEDIFHNGQIRPTRSFNSEEATTSYGPPVRKVFVVSSPERDDVAEGPYCGWSSSDKLPAKPPAPAPEMSRKSNSTGFSKLWRFRDLLVRSNSDGKDAFVFLTGKGDEKASEKKEKKQKEKEKLQKTSSFRKEEEKTKKGKKKNEKSAYEVFYGKREQEKKAGKGKPSYLPYKVGFFINVNGMSRNIHPY